MTKSSKIKIGIVGISGRMGKSIARAIQKSSDVMLTAGCEYKKLPADLIAWNSQCFLPF